MALSDILPAVHELTILEKIRLIRILAEEIDDPQKNISPLRPNQLYYLPTPYNTFRAGKILMDAMMQSGR